METQDGHRQSRQQTVRKGSERLVQRHRTHRSPVQRLRSGPGAGRERHIRAGARTAWHTHPLGQTLVVTAGFGRAQRWEGEIEELRPGDVVWFQPGEKHWHGASPATAMTHIAIQEVQDGRAVEWMEQVADEAYGAAPRSSAT